MSQVLLFVLALSVNPSTEVLALIEAGEFEVAQKTLSALDGDRATLQYLEGRIRFAQKRYPEASAHFEKAQRAGFKSQTLSFRLGVSYFHSKKFGQAEIVLLPLLKAKSDEIAVDLFRLLAEAAKQRGAPNRALNYLKDGELLFPKNRDLQFDRLRLLLSLGLQEKVLENSGPCFYNTQEIPKQCLAIAQSMNSKNTIRWFEKALKANAVFGTDAWLSFARSLAQAQRYEAASLAYSKSFTTGENQSQEKLEYSEVLRLSGRYIQALAIHQGLPPSPQGTRQVVAILWALDREAEAQPKLRWLKKRGELGPLAKDPRAQSLF